MKITPLTRSHGPNRILAVAVCLFTTAGVSAMDPELGPATQEIQTDNYSTILHVSQSNGADSKKAGSQQNPFSSLTAALEKAAKSPAPTAIRVATGNYAEGTLELPADTHLFGGFSPRDWSRDIHQYPTTLDGAGAGRVLVSRNGGSIDGFFIINGQFSGYGAGILCQGSSPTITNNTFRRNRVLAPLNWNPEFRHELAWDGAAIACIEGSSPIISHNSIQFNETVIGRGAGITVHLNSHPEITHNVLMHNVVGTDDPKRSSDGGGISIYGYCNPLVENNLIAMNTALTSNDAGGLFVALWANPVIRGNTFLGNIGADDAGGLFIGGQEHRYVRDLDPVPGPESFDVLVEGNTFMGNRNGSENSGAMRITMETRARLVNNIMARNYGGVYLQRSEIEFYHNTVDDDLLMVETKETVQASDVRNNIILGHTEILAPTRFTHNATRNFTYGEGNFVVTETHPGFARDGLTAPIADRLYLPERGLTQIDLYADRSLGVDLTGRIIRIENFWSVVAHHSGLRIQVYGMAPELPEAGAYPVLEVIPTYRLSPDAPFIDRGTPLPSVDTDFAGNRRHDDRPDLGAFEYVHP